MFTEDAGFVPAAHLSLDLGEALIRIYSNQPKSQRVCANRHNRSSKRRNSHKLIVICTDDL